MAHGGEEAFTFQEEASAASHSTPAVLSSWRVLLVDDEPDVHAATKLALKGVQVQGLGIEFVHAYSARQAKEILAQHSDFAVAIIDVVMESEDAGLQLVRHIREELGNGALRIILRTGQPGYAPEVETIERYDINDYKTKSELTQVRLFTSLTIAVRSYAQIRQLEAGRRGLEQVLAATTDLGKPTGLNKFASGLVTQLCALLNVGDECLVCAVMHENDGQPYVLAAAGGYAAWIGLAVQDIPHSHVKQRLQYTLQAHQHGFDDGASLFFRGTHGQALAAFVDVRRPLSDLEKGLLEVFCSNMSVAFENLQLYLAINDLAFKDALVQLPNRNALLAAIDAPVGGMDTVAIVDLDDFSDINSTLDDSFGDEVLCAVASRLRACFGSETLVTRLGGDLFGLLGPRQQVTPEGIAGVFSQPFEFGDGESLRLSATSGLVRLEGAPQVGVTVLKNAGAALKQAKRFQRGKALFFQSGQSEAARDRMHLLSRLRASFSDEHLFLHYQPFVHLPSGRVVGAECLLRWKKPDGNYVPPDKFIPIAEQSGLMIPIGEWVMRTALKWRQGLRGRVPDDFRIAINVSHVQFAEPDFVAKCLAMLEEIGLPGAQVEIELTESVAIENTDQLAVKLQELRAHGVSVAMDDFGTGYSSLGVIQRLALDRLKIDRSFVSGPQTDVGTYEIARTIITMAEHLHLSTVAEGIETQAQCDLLLAAGCQEGQGYLFSRPLDAEQFVQWMEQRQPV